MHTRRIFPERLKNLRESLGLTIEAFAKRVGLSRFTQQFYEKGERIPSIETLSQICESADVSPLYLLGYSPMMKDELRGAATELDFPDEDALKTIRGLPPKVKELLSFLVRDMGFITGLHYAVETILRSRSDQDMPSELTITTRTWSADVVKSYFCRAVDDMLSMRELPPCMAIALERHSGEGGKQLRLEYIESKRQLLLNNGVFDENIFNELLQDKTLWEFYYLNDEWRYGEWNDKNYQEKEVKGIE